MTTKAFNAQGTVIKRGNGASVESFTSIGEVKNFNGPSGSANVLDATHLESTAREKVMGLPDEGEITLTMNFDPTSAQHQGLIADRANRVKRNFEQVFSDTGAAKASFAAYVTGFAIVGAVDAICEANVTLAISGPLTWAY